MFVTAERIAALFRIRWMWEINFMARLLYTWGLGFVGSFLCTVLNLTLVGPHSRSGRGNLPPLLDNKPRFLCSLAIRFLLNISEYTLNVTLFWRMNVRASPCLHCPLAATYCPTCNWSISLPLPVYHNCMLWDSSVGWTTTGRVQHRDTWGATKCERRRREGGVQMVAYSLARRIPSPTRLPAFLNLLTPELFF